MSKPVKASKVEKEPGYDDADLRKQKAAHVAGARVAAKAAIAASGAISGADLDRRISRSTARLQAQSRESWRSRQAAAAAVRAKRGEG